MKSPTQLTFTQMIFVLQYVLLVPLPPSPLWTFSIPALFISLLVCLTIIKTLIYCQRSLMRKLQSVLIRQTGRSTVKAGCYHTYLGFL